MTELLPKTAAIVPGCSQPTPQICGVPNDARLRHYLRNRNIEITTDVEKADLLIRDCHHFFQGEEIHLCEADIPELENRMVENLRKPIDGLVSRWINRRISLAITRLLMHSNIHPTHITYVTLLLGLLSGLVVSQGSYGSVLLGAVILQTQSILDGVDGELARLKFQGSKLGQWLDTISDDLGELSFLAGTTWIAHSLWLRSLGVIGIISFITAKGVMYFLLATVYRSGDLLAFRWEVDQNINSWGSRLKLLFKHDFFCLLTVFLALIGKISVALFLEASGAVVVLSTLMMQLVRHGTPPKDRRLTGSPS